MRIAFISYEYPPDTGKGGIGTYTQQVASMLAETGWDVHVFCGTSAKTGRVAEDGIHVHKVHCINGNDFKEKVLPIFLQEHAHKNFELIESPEINSPALHIHKALPKIPLVVRLHAPDYLVESTKKIYYPFKVKARYVAGALRRGRWDLGYWRKYPYQSDPDYLFTSHASQIVAPSAAMKNWAIQNWNLPADSIRVLPNPFNAPAQLLSLPINEIPTKEILFFGRLNVLKGLVNATHAMKQILQKHPDYHFKILGNDGEGPLPRSSMKSWMQQELKAFADRVIFSEGFHYDQLPALIAHADIVVLPSLFESFSYACLEAMAAGKAVVGSSGTGMEDIISHNKDGLLVNPHQVNELIGSITLLIKDNARRISIAHAARKTATEKFNNNAILPQYGQLYKSVARNE